MRKSAALIFYPARSRSRECGCGMGVLGTEDWGVEMGSRRPALRYRSSSPYKDKPAGLIYGGEHLDSTSGAEKMFGNDGEEQTKAGVGGKEWRCSFCSLWRWSCSTRVCRDSQISGACIPAVRLRHVGAF